MTTTIIVDPNCTYELEENYKECLGRYCGRLLINSTQCLFSECGKCPRGYRPSNLGICELCQNDAQIYDYMYLGFIYLFTLMFNFVFIDRSFKKSKDIGVYQAPFNLKKFKVLIILYLSPLLECSLAFFISLLIYSPMGTLKLNSCKINSINDWYSMFYNPYIDYYKKLNCTQEIVYPFYSIVFVYITITTIIMILIRPIIINKMLKKKKELKERLNSSTFISLYFYPILIVIQAIAGGLIYYSYPFLTLIGFLITNAIHLADAFHEIDDTNTSSFRQILNNCLRVYKQPRNIIISILHVLFYAYSVVSLTRFEDLIFSILMLLLIPFPILFFVISYKFTRPDQFRI